MLANWFAIIKHIRNQPYKGSKDIPHKLKTTIENHFKYYRKNDRNSELIEKLDYFEDIPWEFRHKLVTMFLYKDIFEKPSFKSFFEMPLELESSFAYEVAFGFMPRHYQPTEEDRYIIEEEGDVTEITFIVEGNWAIAFNTYVI